jgi:hypothetical protein
MSCGGGQLGFPISTKNNTFIRRQSKKQEYHILGPGLGQAQNCGGVKPLNGVFLSWTSSIFEILEVHVPI